MATVSRAYRFMQDLTGASERRATVTLALLVVAALMLPTSPSVAAPGGPTEPPADPVSVLVAPTPTPTPTPTATQGEQESEAPEPQSTASEDAEPPSLGDMIEDYASEEAAAGDDPGTDGDADGDPTTVEAEGGDAEEVVEAPAAPEGEDVGVAGEDPDQVGVDGEALGEDGVVPPPIETYGVSVVPSLGTAQRPLTNDYAAAEPVVLAPLVAGQDVQQDQAAGASQDSSVLRVSDPARNVAAASLSVVQPSWYATSVALLVMLAAAAYGAVLRRRGEQVPDAIAFAASVRPGDRRAHAVRSVRPADLSGNARSVRP